MFYLIYKKKNCHDEIYFQLYNLQEEDSGSSTVSINMTRTPIPGHISSLRAAEEEQRRNEQEQKRIDTLKDASKKHIDPFTGKGR